MNKKILAHNRKVLLTAIADRFFDALSMARGHSGNTARVAFYEGRASGILVTAYFADVLTTDEWEFWDFGVVK